LNGRFRELPDFAAIFDAPHMQALAAILDVRTRAWIVAIVGL
jgi:hypothetical protein